MQKWKKFSHQISTLYWCTTFLCQRNYYIRIHKIAPCGKVLWNARIVFKNLRETVSLVTSLVKTLIWRKKCENCGNYIFFGKNFVKVTYLLKKLLKSWFHEIFHTVTLWQAFFSNFSSNQYLRCGTSNILVYVDRLLFLCYIKQLYHIKRNISVKMNNRVS